MGSFSAGRKFSTKPGQDQPTRHTSNSITKLAQNRTFEDDFDFQYFFNPVRAGTYHGLSIRQRFFNRDQPTVPYDFKYVRTQLEYDF